jgi:hypothetical protein
VTVSASDVAASVRARRAAVQAPRHAAAATVASKRGTSSATRRSGAQPRVRGDQRDPAVGRGVLRGRDVGQRGEHPAPHAFERRQVAGLSDDGLRDQRVVRVADEHGVLGGEVAEERHLRDARGLGDLGDRRRVVAARLEEVERRVEDAGPRAQGAGCGEGGHAVSVDQM